MTKTTQRQHQFLITWYHPTEYALALDANHWVIGRNDDFGYELTCALVPARSEEAAIRSVRESYTGAPVTICIRSCKAHCGPMEMPSLRRLRSGVIEETRRLQAA